MRSGNETNVKLAKGCLIIVLPTWVTDFDEVLHTILGNTSYTLKRLAILKKNPVIHLPSLREQAFAFSRIDGDSYAT